MHNWKLKERRCGGVAKRATQSSNERKWSWKPKRLSYRARPGYSGKDPHSERRTSKTRWNERKKISSVRSESLPDKCLCQTKQGPWDRAPLNGARLRPVRRRFLPGQHQRRHLCRPPPKVAHPLRRYTISVEGAAKYLAPSVKLRASTGTGRSCCARNPHRLPERPCRKGSRTEINVISATCRLS